MIYHHIIKRAKNQPKYLMTQIEDVQKWQLKITVRPIDTDRITVDIDHVFKGNSVELQRHIPNKSHVTKTCANWVILIIEQK